MRSGGVVDGIPNSTPTPYVTVVVRYGLMLMLSACGGLPAVDTAASLPACDASHAGAERVTKDTAALYVCSGGAWLKLDGTASSAASGTSGTIGVTGATGAPGAAGSVAAVSQTTCSLPSDLWSKALFYKITKFSSGDVLTECYVTDTSSGGVNGPNSMPVATASNYWKAGSAGATTGLCTVWHDWYTSDNGTGYMNNGYYTFDNLATGADAQGQTGGLPYHATYHNPQWTAQNGHVQNMATCSTQ